MDYAEALKEAPSLVAELRKRLMPEKGEKPEISAPAQTPAAPLSIHAMADCDSVYSLLYRHCENVAHLIGGTMPNVPVVKEVSGEPVGLSAGTEPDEAYDHALKLARYLEHQTHLAPRMWQTKIAREVIRTVARLTERYPTHEPEELLNARCRGCERLTLYRYPPKRYRAEEFYKCKSCGLTHTEPEMTAQRMKRQEEIK